jgi:hypothetical protein
MNKKTVIMMAVFELFALSLLIYIGWVSNKTHIMVEQQARQIKDQKVLILSLTEDFQKLDDKTILQKVSRIERMLEYGVKQVKEEERIQAEFDAIQKQLKETLDALAAQELLGKIRKKQQIKKAEENQQPVFMPHPYIPPPFPPLPPVPVLVH